jgi:hypothetical protein
MDTTPVDEKRGSAGLNTRLSCAISLFVYCLSFPALQQPRTISML